MPQRLSRRQVLTSGAVAGGLVLTGGLGQAGASDGTNADYEIWAFDQGTGIGYIYAPDGDGSFEQIDEIDMNELDEITPGNDHVHGDDEDDHDDHDEDDHEDHEEADAGTIVPHMVDFSSDYEYAAVACMMAEQTAIFRTEDRELVAALDTGPGTHFAGFSPDDSFLQVDVIETGTIVRIDADLENERFEIADELVVAEDPAFEQCAHHFNDALPICHQYTDNGYSYHTLGPGVDDAGVVIVDTESFEIAELFWPEQVRANCGTMAHPTESKFYLTAGAPSNHEPTGGVGEWYVFDTETHRPIDNDGNVVEGNDFTHEEVARDSGGIDGHALWFPEGDEELWVLNRETDDGVIADPSADENVEEVEEYGPAQDIMWSSPDGEYMFVTLRGPEPLSGDPHAAEGETPGFSVLDTETRDLIEIIEPDEGNELSDFHGIGVRAIEGEHSGY